MSKIRWSYSFNRGYFALGIQFGWSEGGWLCLLLGPIAVGVESNKRPQPASVLP